MTSCAASSARWMDSPCPIGPRTRRHRSRGASRLHLPALRRADDHHRRPPAQRTDPRTTRTASRSMSTSVSRRSRRPSALRQRNPIAHACAPHTDHAAVRPAALPQRCVSPTPHATSPIPIAVKVPAAPEHSAVSSIGVCTTPARMRLWRALMSVVEGRHPTNICGHLDDHPDCPFSRRHTTITLDATTSGVRLPAAGAQTQ